MSILPLIQKQPLICIAKVAFRKSKSVIKGDKIEIYYFCLTIKYIFKALNILTLPILYFEILQKQHLSCLCSAGKAVFYKQ